MKSTCRLLSLVLFAAVFASATGAALAQSYPNKPIRFIVPYTAGGASDILARAIGQKLTESWGQQVVVDNRGGGGAIIGTELAAKAAPDGYTIFMGASGPLGINPSLHSKLPYDPVKDFAPVTLVAGIPLIMVANNSVPAMSVQELIALAKSKPGHLNMASPGNGTSQHLAGELFKTMAGINLTHIPYKGSAQAVIGLLGGEVSVLFDSLLSSLPHVKAGRLKGLAVTGARRFPAAPDLSTIAESGVPGYEATGWVGVLVPARTANEIVTKLNTEIIKILQMPDIKERLSSLGAEPSGSTPEQFAAYIKAEIIKWAKVVKESGARLD